MKPRLSLLDHLTIAAFVVQAGFAAYVALMGPTTPIPLHWNGDWQVDRWGSRNEFAVALGGMTVIGFIASAGLAAVTVVSAGLAAGKASAGVPVC